MPQKLNIVYMNMTVCVTYLQNYSNAIFMPSVIGISRYCSFNFKFILHSSGEGDQCKIVLLLVL